MNRRELKTGRRLALLLVLGAIINVAVAWGLSVWPIGFTLGAADGFNSIYKDTPNPDELQWLRAHGWTQRAADHDWVVSDKLAKYQTVGLYIRVHAEFRMPKSPTAHDASMPITMVAMRVQSGWPLKCLEGAVVNHTIERPADAFVISKLTTYGTVRYPGISAVDQRSIGVWKLPAQIAFLKLPPNRMIPLGPLWNCFVINSLFYAAILWLFMAVPSWFRHWLRVRRHCCPACAYPIGTSPVCTECGAAVCPRTFSRRP